MSEMKQYIVDAFTDQPFSGNPAAVCVMERLGEKAFAEVTLEKAADRDADKDAE